MDDLLKTLDDLERAAKATTPGPWETTEGAPIAQVYNEDDFPCLDREELTDDQLAEFEGNAVHIAACNPAAILSLVAQVRGLVERVKELEAGEFWKEVERLSAERRKFEDALDLMIADRDRERKRAEDAERLLATANHKLDSHRQRIEEAHKTFHELVGPNEPVRFQHSPEEDFDPAAQMRRLAAARDEARVSCAEAVALLREWISQFLPDTEGRLNLYERTRTFSRRTENVDHATH